MDNKEAKLPKIKSLTKVKAPLGIVGLKNNSSFCGAVFKQNKIASIVDDNISPFQERSDLIYSSAPSLGYDQDVLARIIELLLQLRAAQSDQNVFVQNNTVVREQILSQLKNEILRVNNRLTKSQIKNLEVVSSNSFDAKALNDILKSLIEDSKKKLGNEEPAAYGSRVTRILNDFIISKISKVSSKVVSRESYEKNLINRIYKDTSFEDEFLKGKTADLKSGRKKAKIQADDAKKGEQLKKAKKEKVKTKKELVQPEVLDLSEKNVLKIFKEVLPIIKTNRKIVHTSLLENLIRFVKSKEEKPIILTTVESKEKINRHKNIYESESVDIPLKSREIYTELINRKTVDEYSGKEEVKTAEKTEVTKRRHFLEKDLADKVNENNILLKEFKEKIARHKNILKHTKFENKYITDEDIKTEKIFEGVQTSRKNLVHKTEKTFKSYDENVTYENIINDVFKKSFQKDITKTQKDIKRNVDILKKENLQEKLNFITEKGKVKTVYKEGEPKFIYDLEVKNLSGKAFDIENIVKNIPVYKNKDEFVKNIFENVIRKNIARIFSPKTILKSTFIKDKKGIFKNIVTSNVNKYIGEKEFVYKDIFDNVRHIEKEVPSYVSTPTEDYMIYKKGLTPEKETEKKGKTAEKQKKIIDKFEKDINLKPQEAKTNEIDEKQIERNIMAKTLKKSEVEKMIKEHMSKIDLESISREIVERVEDRFIMDRERNGIF